MGTLIERINASRTELPRVEHEHATAQKMLTMLKQDCPAVAEPSAWDLVQSGEIPDIDELVKIRARHEAAAPFMSALQRFLNNGSHDKQMTMLSDADAMLAVMRDAVNETLDEIPKVVVELTGVTSAQEAILLGAAVEWRRLSELTADLEVVAREYTRVAQVFIGTGTTAAYVRSLLFPHDPLPQIGRISDNDHPDNYLPYNVDDYGTPIMNERYSIWLSALDEDRLVTLRELPHPDVLGGSSYTPKSSDALAEPVFA